MREAREQRLNSVLYGHQFLKSFSSARTFRRPLWQGWSGRVGFDSPASFGSEKEDGREKPLSHSPSPSFCTKLFVTLEKILTTPLNHCAMSVDCSAEQNQTNASVFKNILKFSEQYLQHTMSTYFPLDMPASDFIFLFSGIFIQCKVKSI